jgi:HAD superfamily hydrolase (TIGR01509 family)
VVFDLDGTLVVQELDFEAIRREIGLPPRAPVLEALEGLPGPEQGRARAILDRHELAAAATAVLQPGVHAFLDWLTVRGMRRGLLSRNSRTAVRLVLERCGLHFDPVLARDDAPYKPSPEGLWQICRAWQLAPAEVLMVGDYLYDIQAGRNAGVRTVLLTYGRTWPFADQADLAVAGLEALPVVLRGWLDGEG